MNECKLGPSKSLQSSISLERYYCSNTPTSISHSRNSFLGGNQSLTIKLISNLSKNKKPKQKQKMKWRNGKIEKKCKDEYEKGPERKRRSVPFIPEAIKFRSESKTRVSCILEKAWNGKDLLKEDFENKENEMVMSHSIMRAEKYVNEQYIKSSLKTHRSHFMSQAYKVFDLFISNTNLPPFVESFLSQPLLILRKNNRMSLEILEKSYDSKFNEFKNVCETVYENSKEEDIKHFMELSLPCISKWIPKSIVHSTAVNLKKFNKIAEIRKLNEGNQFYFRGLNKEETDFNKPNEEKLNSKLDQCIGNLKSPSMYADEFEEFKELSKKHKNKSEVWRKRKSFEEV